MESLVLKRRILPANYLQLQRKIDNRIFTKKYFFYEKYMNNGRMEECYTKYCTCNLIKKKKKKKKELKRCYEDQISNSRESKK